MEFIHLFGICHHVPLLDTLASAGRAPSRWLLEKLHWLMSLKTSDAISSHLPGVSWEMALYFQLIEQTMVPPPKAPNEQHTHICDHVHAFLPDFS